MISDPALKISAKVALREVFTPTTMSWFLIILTMPIWLNPVLYVFLKTLTFDPNGILVWALLIGISTFSFWSWFSFFRSMIRFSKQMRPLVIASRAGDIEATQKSIELRKNRPNPHQFLQAMHGIYLMIPLVIVITICLDSAVGQHLVNENGKPRPSTRQENIQNIIHAFEARGIFLPMSF